MSTDKTGITLMRTCFACPEQYDALDEHGNVVGYLRLRHGHFTVQAHPPGWDGEGYGPVVYEATPQGDGIFDPDERDWYLSAAKAAIARCVAGRPAESLRDRARRLADAWDAAGPYDHLEAAAAMAGLLREIAEGRAG